MAFFVFYENLYSCFIDDLLNICPFPCNVTIWLGRPQGRLKILILSVLYVRVRSVRIFVICVILLSPLINQVSSNLGCDAQRFMLCVFLKNYLFRLRCLSVVVLESCAPGCKTDAIAVIVAATECWNVNIFPTTPWQLLKGCNRQSYRFLSWTVVITIVALLGCSKKCSKPGHSTKAQ